MRARLPASGRGRRTSQRDAVKTLLIQEGGEEGAARLFLASRGCEVVLCRSLAEAERVPESAPFEWVIVDVGDRLGAEAFCRRWRALGFRQKASFILCGLEPAESKAAGEILSAGADDLFLRPLSLSELAIRWTTAVRQRQLREEWASREEALNTRAQQQVAVAALGQCALSEDLPTLIDLVNRFILYTLEVEFCSLLEFTEDAKSLRWVAGFGWPEEQVGRLLAPPPATSVIGRTLSGEDLLVEDLAQDPRGFTPDFLTEQGVVSAISVAIKGKERGVFGALGAYTSRRKHLADDDLRFLEGLANVLGGAMERRHTEAEVRRHQDQVQHLQRLESVGQLAAALAHDYNNVLTVIHGHVTLALGASSLPPKIEVSLKTVLEAVERASRLTRQLLSFSRKQSMEPEPMDLNAAIADMAKLLDRVLGKGIRLEIHSCATLPTIHADSGLLDQVLMNLAVNARDAMPNGGKLLISTSVLTLPSQSTRTHPDAQAGEFVCLTVADTGCGMDEGTLRRIFDPFFTTKPPDKGTGLGLSTVYGIVKQHQGWVEVESQPGLGSTFRVLLPSVGTTPAARETAGDPEGASAQRTVLLVDNESGMRQVTRVLLEDLGCEVAEATSAQEAFGIWSQEKSHLRILVTDFVLPDGLTGLELAERLRQDNPNLQIVLTSGYRAEEMHKHFCARSGFYFIQKPYGKEALAKTLRACFNPK